VRVWESVLKVKIIHENVQIIEKCEKIEKVLECVQKVEKVFQKYQIINHFAFRRCRLWAA